MTVDLDRAEQLATLELRARNGGGFCLHEHTIHRDDEPDCIVMRITCDQTPPAELGRLHLPCLATDPSAEVSAWVGRTVAAHNEAAANAVVLALVARVRALEADKRALTDAGNRMADELVEWAVMEPAPSVVGRSNADAVRAWRLLVDDTEARP